MISEVTVERDTHRHTHAEENKYCPEFHIHIQSTWKESSQHVSSENETPTLARVYLSICYSKSILVLLPLK